MIVATGYWLLMANVSSGSCRGYWEIPTTINLVIVECAPAAIYSEIGDDQIDHIITAQLRRNNQKGWNDQQPVVTIAVMIGRQGSNTGDWYENRVVTSYRDLRTCRDIASHCLTNLGQGGTPCCSNGSGPHVIWTRANHYINKHIFYHYINIYFCIFLYMSVSFCICVCMSACMSESIYVTCLHVGQLLISKIYLA